MDQRIAMQLRSELGLDPINCEYFLALLRLKKASSAAVPKAMFVPGQQLDEKISYVYPTAVAPPELLANLPIQNFENLRGDGEYLAEAKESVLWVKQMHAGTGSGIKREAYLRQLRQLPATSKPAIGAKSTDIFFSAQRLNAHFKNVLISVAEAQLLKLIQSAKQGEYSEIICHDIVSPETLGSINALWEKESLFSSNQSYHAFFENHLALRRWGQTQQAHLPTLDENQDISFQRKAPGGHGLFAVEALRAAIQPGALPDVGQRPLVAAIGNGEDLGSLPFAEMVGWVVGKRVGVVMVTTDKTPIDLQGGQISVVQNPTGESYATILETAQAKEMGQLDLFQKIGLEIGEPDRRALFNTNLALFNYQVLVPKIKELVRREGEDVVLSAMMPELIEKWRPQVDSDGVTRNYLQLEGAMGSSLLNFDRLWRRVFNEPLVHFINVKAVDRASIFSPLKNTFDIFMNLHSDRIYFEPNTLRPCSAAGATLPKVSLQGSKGKPGYWLELKNLLDAFQNTRIKDLHSLNVNGLVNVSGMELAGDISLMSETESIVDVKKETGKALLKDQVIDLR